MSLSRRQKEERLLSSKNWIKTTMGCWRRPGTNRNLSLNDAWAEHLEERRKKKA